MRRHLPVLFVAAALVAFIAVFLSRPPPPVIIPRPLARPALSLLAPAPDWRALDIYQNAITRTEFERLLTDVFTTGPAWRTFIGLDDAEASIQTGEGVYLLRFGQENPAPRHWRATSELPPAAAGQPLSGLRIAIDPGHIGGAWAKMEERWFVVGEGTPVQEGDMTLHVAKLLKPRLEALGATVSLVRETTEPVTPIRPEVLLTTAGDNSKLAERLFYRTAEIRARADLVNLTLKPDLVLCLHFNAEAWGDPHHPTLIDRTHFHLILNGAYNDDEVLLADQRFSLLRKLLQRTHAEEVLVGSTVATTFAEISGLPPYVYPPDSKNALPVLGQPFLWVRNLIANRLYDCPVIFMEPYVMNSTLDHARIQAGDYDGLREISGINRPSIFREYADALSAGLARHYGSRPVLERKTAPADDR